MPFHLNNALPKKSFSLQYQKIHEYQYKSFLKTLETKKSNTLNATETNLYKRHHQSCYSNNYLIQREKKLDNRYNQRKLVYERIQNENLKFTQKLINAKAFLNRNEQKSFYDKHCKLKQQFQRYSKSIKSKTMKYDILTLSKLNLKASTKPAKSSVLIYENNHVYNRLIKLEKKPSKITSHISTLDDSLSNKQKMANS